MKKFVYRPADIKEFVYSIIEYAVHKQSCVQFVIHKVICEPYNDKYHTQTNNNTLSLSLRSVYL